MTGSTTAAQIAAGQAAATQLAPLFGPNATLAVSIANGLLTAVMAANTDGRDVTDAEIVALLSLDDAARADAIAAQREARAAGDTSGADPG